MMKHLLLTTIAAVVLVGCGESMSFHDAVSEGKIEAVKQHLATGTDVNAKDDWNSTPLPYAARGGHIEIAELLIANGADVNARVSHDKGIPGLTPLFYAARGDSSEIAELLIANDAEHVSPLTLTATCGHDNFITFMNSFHLLSSSRLQHFGRQRDNLHELLGP